MSGRVIPNSTSAGAGGPGESVGAAGVQAPSGLPRTRAGTAWVLACAAAVTLLALIVFITQNLHPAEVSFLWWHGRFPLAVALLAATLVGAVLTLVLGSTRILQLRRTAIRSRRDRVRSRSPHEKSGSSPTVS